MVLYALRRLIYLVPVAFGVSLLVFALVHLAPGDAISAIVPPDAPKEVVDKLKEYYGFDKPLPVQYGRWLGNALRGNLGKSYQHGLPATQLVADRIRRALEIVPAEKLIINPDCGCVRLPRDVAFGKLKAMVDEAAARGKDLVRDMIGRLKRDELAARKDPTALALMRSIKRALDPLNLLNPGRVL